MYPVQCPCHDLAHLHSPLAIRQGSARRQVFICIGDSPVSKRDPYECLLSALMHPIRVASYLRCFTSLSRIGPFDLKGVGSGFGNTFGAVPKILDTEYLWVCPWAVIRNFPGFRLRSQREYNVLRSLCPPTARSTPTVQLRLGISAFQVCSCHLLGLSPS